MFKSALKHLMTAQWHESSNKHQALAARTVQAESGFYHPSLRAQLQIGRRLPGLHPNCAIKAPQCPMINGWTATECYNDRSPPPRCSSASALGSAKNGQQRLLLKISNACFLGATTTPAAPRCQAHSRCYSHDLAVPGTDHKQ